MNNQGRQWSTVAAGSDNQQWKPQATEKTGMHFIPGAPTNVLEGYLSDTKEIKGQNGIFFVHVIQLMEPHGALGECIDVMGDTVLNDRLGKLEMGSYVRLEYKGRVHKKGYPANSPWSQTNSYHNWDVAVDEGAVKLHQLMGIKPAGVPVSNQPQFNQSAPQQQGGYQQPQFANPQTPQQAWAPPAQNQPIQYQPAQNQQQEQPRFNPAPAQTNFPPANGNFGGNQQPIVNPMQGGSGVPFDGNDGLPF